MPEPTDAIFPILQRIQADLASLNRKVDAQGEILNQQTMKLDAIEGYLTYQLGVSSRTIADVEALKSRILESKYPPAEPGALDSEPLKAAGRVASVCLLPRARSPLNASPAACL